MSQPSDRPSSLAVAAGQRRSGHVVVSPVPGISALGESGCF